jgi:hypothetical protein
VVVRLGGGAGDVESLRNVRLSSLAALEASEAGDAICLLRRVPLIQCGSMGSRIWLGERVFCLESRMASLRERKRSGQKMRRQPQSMLLCPDMCDF